MKKCVLVLALLLWAISALAAPTVTVTITPMQVKPGDIVTISVRLVSSAPPTQVIGGLSFIGWYNEGNITQVIPPFAAPIFSADPVVITVSRPMWKLTVPAGWTYVSSPVSSGYLNAYTMNDSNSIRFNAEALLNGTGITSWQMRAGAAKVSPIRL